MNEFVMNTAGIGLAALGIVFVLTLVCAFVRGLFSHWDRWHYAIVWESSDQICREDLRIAFQIDRAEAVSVVQDYIKKHRKVEDLQIVSWTLYRRENAALTTAWAAIKGKLAREKKEGW